MLGLVSKKGLDVELGAVRDHLLITIGNLNKESARVAELNDEIDNLSLIVARLEKKLAAVSRTKVNISALDGAIDKKLGSKKQVTKKAKDAKGSAKPAKRKKPRRHKS
jgi:hypothetical protein